MKTAPSAGFRCKMFYPPSPSLPCARSIRSSWKKPPGKPERQESAKQPPVVMPCMRMGGCILKEMPERMRLQTRKTLLRQSRPGFPPRQDYRDRRSANTALDGGRSGESPLSVGVSSAVFIVPMLFPKPMCPLKADQKAEAPPATTSQTQKETLAIFPTYHNSLILSIITLRPMTWGVIKKRRWNKSQSNQPCHHW